MPELNVVIEPSDALDSPLPSPPTGIARYTREVPTGSDGDAVVRAVAERNVTISPDLHGQLDVSDYAADTAVDLRVATAAGVTILSRPGLEPEQEEADDDGEAPRFHLRVSLTDSEVEQIQSALSPNPPETPQVLDAAGRFGAVGDEPLDFTEYTLLVSPVTDDTIPDDVLEDLFDVDAFETTAVALSDEAFPGIASLQLSRIHDVDLRLQGRFTFKLPVAGDEAGWVWLLSGPTVFLGIQPDPVSERRSTTRTILLPVTDDTADGATPRPTEPSPSNDGGDGARPIDATENELLGDPDLFSDDPGAFCEPFRTPDRIVGERSFNTILRVTQPEIGGDPSVPPPDRLPPFPFSPELADREAVLARSSTPSEPTPVELRRPGVGLTNMVGRLRELAPESPLVSTRAALAERRPYVLSNSRGRRELGGDTALEWEGDSTIYQAVSLGFGHVLEFRTRWRSNGYSLGNVAHTLTLAPRQTRRIVTVESRIADEARRVETMTVAEEVSQRTEREYSYSDAVASHLSEWSKGGSQASTTGAAGGVGFALGGFVIGGGAAHGQSQSSSWQRGGRDVSASEEQSLRDAIRQHGESLRSLESMVVVEEEQVEIQEATSEVVRNPNYCHSLTVIYHEILRHLRIDTEVVGARECVFVPLAIRPFTLERVIRWRDVLERHLRKEAHRRSLRHLEAVNEDFSSGDVPEGPRFDHPVRHVTGTVRLQLAIERPEDGSEDDPFSESDWQRVSPFVGQPVRGIFERLRELAEEERDAEYQREYAPTIAAGLVDRLQLGTEDGTLDGVDFTLASRYRFNGTLRVEFSYSPDGELTRGDLQRLTVSLPDDVELPPRSVANLRGVEVHYYTETFDRRESSPTVTDDLIDVETGMPEPDGASAVVPLSGWEREDLREVIVGGVKDLITHLNEHVEYYHKAIWWNLDPDKLYMMLDSVYVRDESDGRSVASVVEHEPVAIVGNNLVYQVAAGAHLGVDGHEDPDALDDYYRDTTAEAEPIRVSLPTSGLYAQAIMDDCVACEEHFGSTDWILSDEEPELAELGPESLRSRRADLPSLEPSELPASIINLQNAADVPAPSGLADVLAAVQNAEAFRDMAGLEGTQANARAALEAAASLATQFGTKAVELRKAQMAARLAQEKLAVVDKAHRNGDIDQAEKEDQTKRVLDEMNAEMPMMQPLTQESAIEDALGEGGSLRVTRADADGSQTVEVQRAVFGSSGGGPLPPLEWPSDAEDLLGEAGGLPEGVVETINNPFRTVSASGGLFMPEYRNEVLEERVAEFASRVDDDAGREQVAKTIVAISTIVADDVADEVEDLLAASPGTVGGGLFGGDGDVCVPKNARPMAARVGRLLAWVDIAIKQAFDDEAEDVVREHHEEWAIMSQLGSHALGQIWGLIPLAGQFPNPLEVILDEAIPDVDEEVADVEAEFRQIRDVYRKINRDIFEDILVKKVPGQSTGELEAPFPERREIIERYDDWVIGGWADELAGLGFSRTHLEL